MDFNSKKSFSCFRKNLNLHILNKILLFLQVKTQLQSQAPGNIAVGTQHNHKGTLSAFKSLWREGGLKGIYRGWHVGVPRISVGSATQLTTYSVVVDYLKPREVNVISYFIRIL